MKCWMINKALFKINYPNLDCAWADFFKNTEINRNFFWLVIWYTIMQECLILEKDRIFIHLTNAPFFKDTVFCCYKTMAPKKDGTLSMMKIKSSWRKHKKFKVG